MCIRDRSYIWPLILMIVSNTVYHVCAKSLPTKLDPLASLTVSYFFAAISSGIPVSYTHLDVYKRQYQDSNRTGVEDLLAKGRVDFIFPADYRSGTLFEMCIRDRSKVSWARFVLPG